MESSKICDTLTREKQMFVSIEPGRVCMYVHGAMVYDYCRVGHARIMVVFDMVQRWLRAAGYGVIYVRNTTDIDDKTIKRVIKNSKAMSALMDRLITAMHEDADTLGAQRPDREPRATEYVPQMLSMIGRLQTNGLAYQMADGDVNYTVRKFPGYGKLSDKSLEDLYADERVAANDAKQDPLDFMLWESAKAEELAESHWVSPWGGRRPGWHIECLAMSYELLDEHFDLHDGDADLQFPYYENEIAQSEGATGKASVNTWIRNGPVRMNSERMSKSLDDSFTIHDVLKLHDTEAVRFSILRSHYRSDLSYNDAHLGDARHAPTRLYTMFKDVSAVAGTKPDWNESHGKYFLETMNDDFNAPVTTSALFELMNEVNRAYSSALTNQLAALAGTLGLLGRDPHAFLQGGVSPDGLDITEAEARIEERRTAKAARDFTRADAIRVDLLATGIALEDKPGGVTERRRV